MVIEPKSFTTDSVRVRRKHPLTIRWCHWVNFPILFVMIWSGLLIYWANDEYALHWGDKVFFHFFPDSVYHLLHLDSRLAEGMSVHFAFMWLFGLNGVLYVLYNLVSGEWRQLMPDRNSLVEARDVILSHFWLAREPEHSGNFNGMQRMTYLAIICMGFGSLVTGLAIYKPAQLYWIVSLLGGYAWARTEHFGLTLGFLAFFVVHIFEVARAGWNNFRSMVTGYEAMKPHE
jgi:thiosulfate reductase cytochrome b subunit